jgi:hypothetical protein
LRNTTRAFFRAMFRERYISGAVAATSGAAAASRRTSCFTDALPHNASRHVRTTREHSGLAFAEWSATRLYGDREP